MTDEGNTSGATSESGAAADNAQTGTGTGNPSGDGGRQNADAGAAFEEILSRHLAPIVERQTRLENALNSRTRHDRKKSADGGDGTDPKNSKTTEDGDSDLRRELEVLKAKDQERAEKEEATRLDSQLGEMIKKGGFVNADVLSDLIRPWLKRGESGALFYDRNGKMRPVDEVVREFGSRDMFQPPPGKGAGTGASGKDAGGEGGGGGNAQLPVYSRAQYSKLPMDKRRAIMDDVFAGKAVLKD